jgi:subtilisin
VIDTGIELAHEDLKNVLWRNPGEIPANGIDDDHNGYIDDVNGYNFATHNGSPQYLTSVTGYQHGTHVSGLAAAQASNGLGGSGVMGSGARIMMLNVFGDSSGASTSDIANAIRYAADNGASVINISLGGSGRSATYESAITYALRKGVAIFAAAGNEHAELGPDYWMSPGSYGQQFDGMMSVGSIDSANGALSAYSNFSSTFVEILAPGSEDSRGRLGLLSTWPGNKYARIQGTSMSSPVAAGAAAIAFSLMRERGYDPSAATIEYVMAAASIHTPELYGYAAGGRVLNVKSLVEFIIATYPRVTGNHIDPGVPGFKACGH